MARVRATSGLNWLLVLYSAPRGFSTGSPVIPSPQKSTFPNYYNYSESKKMKMASTQVDETSVTNNSPSQDSNHPDDLFQTNYNTKLSLSVRLQLGLLFFYSRW